MVGLADQRCASVPVAPPYSLAQGETIVKNRLGGILAILLVLGVVAPIAAQDAASTGQKPLVTLSFGGYDQLMGTIQKACALAGKPELAKGLEAPLILFTQGRGLAGLDKARPWGVVVYGTPSGQFPVQAFVPVTDLKQLLSLVPKLPPPDAAGVYELPGARGQTFYAAQKGQWAFIVDNKDALGSVPADPSPLLGDLGRKYLLAVRGSVKNLPDAVREKFLVQAKAILSLTQMRRPGESAEQAAIRTNMFNQALENINTLAKELDAAVLGLGMDPSTGAVYLDCEVTAQPGTRTAQRFAATKEAKTNFAGFQIPAAAVTCLSAGTLDDTAVAQLKSTFSKIRTMALKDLAGNDDLTDEQKQVAKQMLGDALDVFSTTIEGRKSDGGMALVLEAGAPTFVAGITISDGAKLEKVLKQLVAEAGKEEPQLAQLIKLDVAKHEGVNFHVATVPIQDEEAAAIFGKELPLVVGIGSDSLYFGAGKNALATLKQVIDSSKRDAGKAIPPMQLAIAAGPIAKFVSQVAPDDTAKMIAGQVSQLLAASGGKDHITMVAQPIPNGSGVRLTVEEGVLKAILNMIPAVGMGPPAGGFAPPAGKNSPPGKSDDPF
jgi:hypothetical protein